MKFNILDLENHFFFFGNVEDALADNNSDVDEVSGNKND